MALVETSDKIEQTQEDRTAVGQMFGGNVLFLGPHRLNVQTYEFAASAVIVSIQYAHLIERPPEVDRAERLVLVGLQTVLVDRRRRLQTES